MPHRASSLAHALLRPAALFAFSAATASGAAQDASTAPLGFVNVDTATVSGALEITGGRAVVRGGGIIVARDRTAELLLNRGGEVNVCATSSLHITAGTSVMGVPPLLLALDRGALEIRMRSTPQDVVITPDLRFSMTAPGPLDLHMRVTPNGDTCVDNKGLQAPVLEIVNQFGDERYQLRAGQHVLFEHGSLREVVDHESSACGCPPPMPAVSVADSGVASSHPAAPGAAVADANAAAEHPFPAAQSEGLAPDPAPANAPARQPPGASHAQVAATMAYGDPSTADGTGPPPASPEVPGTTTSTAASSPTRTPTTHSTPPAATGGTAAQAALAPTTSTPSAAHAQAAAAPAPPGATSIGHRLARFFRRIFGSG